MSSTIPFCATPTQSLLPPYSSRQCSTPTSIAIRDHHIQHLDKLAFILDKSNSLTQLLQIHAVIIRHGHDDNPTLNFKLQKSYASLGRLSYSTTLLDRTTGPNVFFYTSIINAHATRGLHRQALSLYAQMLDEGVEPNAFTFSSLLKCCSIEYGMLIHGHAIKLGLDGDLYVRTGVLDVYARCGNAGAARKVFDTMSERCLVSSTAMLTCYSKHGDLDEARLLFDRMSERDVVCWNVMIDGYTQHGRPNEAIDLSRQMMKSKVKPNEVTLVSVLSACGQLGALELGKWFHFYVVNNRIQINVHVGTSLIDMYSKCGSLEDARLVFDAIKNKDVVTWNAMIVSYAIHGFSDEAFRLFDNMRKLGYHPTDITFIGILNSCAHAGLVKKGKEFFHMMTNVYRIKPKVEHYGCMVNLLGRAGQLREAYELVRTMNIDPDPVIWGTLLGACRLHGNIKLGVEIAEVLITKNVADTGIYVLLSNMYAMAGNWDGVVKVRSMMKESGKQKEPGCSSIEVNNKVHEFLAGDMRHPQSKEIYMMLEEINGWLNDHGYTPQTDIVLHDLKEMEKRQTLEVHSERLAAAFGLISTQPGTTIKIVKNLRVCSDCHAVTKLISKITGRRIIMRDRSRFHHFVNGSCSCGDFW